MKICCLEYDYSTFNGGAATYNRETAKFFNKHKDVFEVDFVQYEPIEKENTALKTFNVNDVDMEAYDFVIHGMVNCVKRPTDEILELLISLKQPRTIFLDHDRYPVHRTFWGQKKKARSAMACDFVITFNPFMYDLFDEFNEETVGYKRVYEYNTWLNYRDISDMPEPKPLADRTFDVMYQARIAPKKGSDTFLEFATKMKNICLPVHLWGEYEVFQIFGFTGMPAEIGCKTHPSVFTQIHKSPDKIIYNTPASFVKLNKFENDVSKVYENFSNAKVTWAAYKVSKQNRETNLKMHPGFEGGQLEALAAGTILICNGLQRKLELCGQTFEEWDCCFFIDDNDTDQLIEDIKAADLQEKYDNLLKFREIIFNDDNFIDGWLSILSPMTYLPKAKTKVIEESTFKELKAINEQA